MYVPQVGDKVYYIWKGHEQYLLSRLQGDESLQNQPWVMLCPEVSLQSQQLEMSSALKAVCRAVQHWEHLQSTSRPDMLCL